MAEQGHACACPSGHIAKIHYWWFIWAEALCFCITLLHDENGTKSCLPVNYSVAGLYFCNAMANFWTSTMLPFFFAGISYNG